MNLISLALMLHRWKPEHREQKFPAQGQGLGGGVEVRTGWGAAGGLKRGWTEPRIKPGCYLLFIIYYLSRTRVLLTTTLSVRSKHKHTQTMWIVNLLKLQDPGVLIDPIIPRPKRD